MDFRLKFAVLSGPHCDLSRPFYTQICADRLIIRYFSRGRKAFTRYQSKFLDFWTFWPFSCKYIFFPMVTKVSNLRVGNAFPAGFPRVTIFYLVSDQFHGFSRERDFFIRFFFTGLGSIFCSSIGNFFAEKAPTQSVNKVNHRKFVYGKGFGIPRTFRYVLKISKCKKINIKKYFCIVWYIFSYFKFNKK